MKECTSFLEPFLLWMSNLFLPYTWWMSYSIVPNLIFYNQEDIVIKELLLSFEQIILMQTILQNCLKCHLFPFRKISHDMDACEFVLLPLTTRTTFCLQLSVHLSLLLIAFHGRPHFGSPQLYLILYLSLSIHSDTQCVTLSLCYHVLVTMHKFNNCVCHSFMKQACQKSFHFWNNVIFHFEMHSGLLSPIFCVM